MEKLKVEYRNIDELIPYENNPRKNDDAVDYVANSIKEFGFKMPIVVDRGGVIIAGHTRLKASKKLGLKEVPVIIADDLTDEQVKALRLADNKVGEIAEWDFNMLDKELAELDIDMSQFHFDNIDINADGFGEEFEISDQETPLTRTITLSLNEEQYAIAMAVIDYVESNDLIEHDFGNYNKKSNALFEGVYQWAEQKKLL